MAHSVYDGVLELTNRQFLEYKEEGNSVFQVEDGTKFYYNPELRQLYVKWQLGRAGTNNAASIQADAKLPDGYIRSVCPHGNAIYIEAGGKVYKAFFTLADGITVSHVKDLQKDEAVHSAGLCNFTLTGKHYAYRLCDDPSRDAILLDLPDAELKPWCIHRGKLYYIRENESNMRPSVHKLGENAVQLEVPGHMTVVSYASEDSCRFLYFADGRTQRIIYTIDTQTLKFLPFMNTNIDNFCIEHVVGVRNGVITLKGFMDSDSGRKCLMSAHLPKEYFHIVPVISRERNEMQKMREQHDREEQIWAREKAEMNLRHNNKVSEMELHSKRLKQMNTTVNEDYLELRTQMRELKTQLDQYKTADIDNKDANQALRADTSQMKKLLEESRERIRELELKELQNKDAIAELNNEVKVISRMLAKATQENERLLQKNAQEGSLQPPPLPSPQQQHHAASATVPSAKPTQIEQQNSVLPPVINVPPPSHPTPSMPVPDLPPPVAPPAHLPPPPPPPGAAVPTSESIASSRSNDNRSDLLSEIRGGFSLRPTATQESGAGRADNVADTLRRVMGERRRTMGDEESGQEEQEEVDPGWCNL